MTGDEWLELREKDKVEKMTTERGKICKDMTTSIILICLTNNTLWEVLGLIDSTDIRDKLERRYMSKLLTSRLYLKKRLLGLQMTEEADFNQHIDEFNKLMKELDSLEVRIEEEEKALLLLSSLPSSFGKIMTTLLFGKDSLRLDAVVAALLRNETRQGTNRFLNVG